MLTVISNNKSHTSIAIDKGILKAHGIRSWIWDSNGCSWYDEQGAIRCRLVVSSDKIEEAIEILNSNFTENYTTEQTQELPRASSGLPPNCGLAMLFVLILIVFSLLILSPWIIASLAKGEFETLLFFVTTPYIPLAVIASIPVGWGLHLIDFYKSRTGFLKALGIIFIHMVTWITVVPVFLYYQG